MKERGILFSAPMVRALLAGVKTQTRRPVKITHRTPGLAACLQPPVGAPRPHVAAELCPYGQPGDRLWVRESGVRSLLAGGGDQMGMFRHDVPATPDTGHWWIESTRAPGAGYNAAACTRQAALLCTSAKVCPSIHMPRWACRILLEIVAVRVERLNDCSESDARAEGVTIEDRHMSGYCAVESLPPSIRAYRDLWESINVAGSWAANPWVWVVEFKRVVS